MREEGLVIVTDEELHDLRVEFNRTSFKHKLHTELPYECCNCGSTENIEYHHIVPLYVGGTNRISNIVPLCPRCHKLFHFATKSKRNIAYKNSSCGGRPKKPMPEGAKEYVDLYLDGKIGLKECVSNFDTNRKKNTLKDCKWFKDYLDELGIKDFRNNIDIVEKNGVLYDGKAVGSVTYKNGDMRTLFYNS